MTKREHGLTQAQVQRCLILLYRWKSYVQLWHKWGYAPSSRRCQALWGFATTSAVAYVLQQMVDAGLIRRPIKNVNRGYMPNAEIVEMGSKLYALTRYGA